MKISYTTLCETCQKDGVQSRLFRDLSEPETVQCPKGHKFSGPEIEELLDAPKPEIPGMKAAPEHLPADIVPMPPLPKRALEEVREMEEAAQRITGALPALEMAPPPVQLTPSSSLTLPVKPVPEQAAVAVAEKPVPSKASDPRILPRMPKELPGGALEIVVTIPDPEASYLKGEAEFRGKSVQEHFQEMVIFGCGARWFY